MYIGSAMVWRLWRIEVAIGLWLLVLAFALPSLAGTPLRPFQLEINAIIAICETNRPSSWAAQTANWSNCDAFFNAWPELLYNIQQSSNGAITNLCAYDDVVELHVWWHGVLDEC